MALPAGRSKFTWGVISSASQRATSHDWHSSKDSESSELSSTQEPGGRYIGSDTGIPEFSHDSAGLASSMFISDMYSGAL